MQTNKRKKDIINEARKLVVQKGWDQWNLAELCSVLNISLGNLTYYFPKKEHLITALFEQAKSEAQDLFLEANVLVKDYQSWEDSLVNWLKWWKKYAFLKDFQQIKNVERKALRAWEDLIEQRTVGFANQWELMRNQKVLKSEKYDGQHEMLRKQYLTLERYNQLMKEERALAVRTFFFHLLSKGSRNNLEI